MDLYLRPVKIEMSFVQEETGAPIQKWRTPTTSSFPHMVPDSPIVSK